MNSLPDPDQARRILETLAEHGVPPGDGIEYFTEGFEPILDALRDRYLDGLLKDGRSGFKLVQARYGGGKTHFLYCLRSLAMDRDFAAALVELAPGSCAYDRPIQVYREVASRLEASIDGRRVGGGLDHVLTARLESQRAKAGDARLSDWLDQVVRGASVDSRSFRAAVYRYLKALLDNEPHARDVLGAWLLGEAVPSAEVRRFGVYERMQNSNAFMMLRSMCQLLREVGFAGSVLLFDEVDRILSGRRGSSGSRAFTDNLRDIVDLVGRHELPGTLFVYAVPGDEFWRLAADYQALHERLRPALPATHSPLNPVIDLESLDMDEAELLAAIGRRLCSLYEVMAGKADNNRFARENMARLATKCAGRMTDRGNRRLFVKTAASLLVHGVASEESLDEDALRSALQKTAAVPRG